MHKLKIWIRGFFGFSRKETNAFLILLPLMIIILLSEPVYRKWKFRNDDHNLFDRHYADSVLATLTYPTIDTLRHSSPLKKEIHFRAFDPNVVSEKELAGLGLPSFMASRIVRYRAKGGVFRKKEDLLRVYGMDSSWFRKASPWITLAEKPQQTSQWAPVERKTTKPEVLDINAADSIQLIDVFGVGPTLSRRIRSYREKLGGFVSLDQLGEVYGVDTLALKALKKRFVLSQDFVPRQISLNSETLEGLSHPYMKRKEAQAIINYRKQHGNFESVDDVLKVYILTPAWLEKIRPYLKL